MIAGLRKSLDRDCLKGLAPPRENARQTGFVIFIEIDQAAGDVNRTVCSENQAPTYLFGTTEISGEAGGGPNRCRVWRDNTGWRHEEIAGHGFVNPSRQKAGEGDFNRLIAGIGEVNLGAPKISVAALKIVSENRENELTGSRR